MDLRQSLKRKTATSRALNDFTTSEKLQKANVEFTVVQKYNIKENEEAASITDKVKLAVSKELHLSGLIQTNQQTLKSTKINKNNKNKRCFIKVEKKTETWV